MKARAPGKIILSGEHAVLYGHPALVMSVDCYATASIGSGGPPGATFYYDHFPSEAFSFSDLSTLKAEALNHYSAYQAGLRPVSEILKSKATLAQFTIAMALEAISANIEEKGLTIRIQSQIPMGCGMGSSAATILSLIAALTKHMGHSLDDDALFQWGHRAEHLQHGRSSGIDLKVAMAGGCYFLENQSAALNRFAGPTFPFAVVHSGTPETTTGECVMASAPYFKDPALGEAFASVTRALAQSLAGPATSFLGPVRANHRLLCRLGVVPEKVQRFIAAVEAAHGAAKICGAGACRGNGGGVLWALLEDRAELERLVAEFQYSLLTVSMENQGVHYV